MNPSEPNLSIRRVRGDEWKAVRDIRFRCLEDSPDAFAASLEETQARTDQHWIERAEGGASGGDEAIFAAVDEHDRWMGVVMGYVDHSVPSVMNLVSMWSDPEVRGRGVGAALVRELLAWVDTTNVATVELWVMRNNGGAQRLYESMGFTVTDNPQSDPGSACRDELCMVRPANPGAG